MRYLMPLILLTMPLLGNAAIPSEVYIADAVYQYAKQCSAKGKTAYADSERGFQPISIAEYSYARNYMINITQIGAMQSGSSLSTDDIESTLKKNRGQVIRTMTTAGKLRCL